MTCPNIFILIETFTWAVIRHRCVFCHCDFLFQELTTTVIFLPVRGFLIYATSWNNKTLPDHTMTRDRGGINNFNIFYNFFNDEKTSYSEVFILPCDHPGMNQTNQMHVCMQQKANICRVKNSNLKYPFSKNLDLALLLIATCFNRVNFLILFANVQGLAVTKVNLGSK